MALVGTLPISGLGYVVASSISTPSPLPSHVSGVFAAGIRPGAHSLSAASVSAKHLHLPFGSKPNTVNVFPAGINVSARPGTKK